MKRVLAIALSAAMLVSMMAGCSSNENSTETSTNTTEQTTEAPETTEEEAPAEEEASTEEETSSEIVAPEADVEMQYITVEDASANLESDDYTFIDVRKAEDYAASHIPGAISADMDAAKNGDFDAGVATMQEVLNSGVDNNLVLICYSGKTYAQATTNVLSALGYDMSKVYTLEGGFTAWTETYPDNVESGEAAADTASAEIVAPESDVEMQYITVEDASANLESDDYTFIDVRKAEDYATSHIPGAISADMDAAKNGDFDAGVATMQEVLNSGVDNNLVLICYSGKTYAQATTNVLSALGYDMSKVYTLEGGFTAWTETYPDNVESGEAAADTASAEIVAPESDVEMQYITVEDASANLESDDYTFIDVRKAEDYATSHIPGAISADMDAAKNGDFDAGVATMQEVLNSGVDNNLVLICYSGKTYAQATTNVLSALGYDMSKVYTLEGGFNAWSETYPDNVEA